MVFVWEENWKLVTMHSECVFSTCKVVYIITPHVVIYIITIQEFFFKVFFNSFMMFNTHRFKTIILRVKEWGIFSANATKFPFNIICHDAFNGIK